MNVTKWLFAGLLIASLGGCFGGKGNIVETCDEPQRYQAAMETKKVEVPEGLDPLDELREMPIPRAEPGPRPDGSKCVELPPSIGTTD